MMKDMKIKYNLFFENQEMGKEEAEAENASLFEANGVDEISDNSLILPINVSYGSGYIMINSEVFD